MGKYGSVMRFVLDRRLEWRDSRAGEGRFGNDGRCAQFLSNSYNLSHCLHQFPSKSFHYIANKI